MEGKRGLPACLGHRAGNAMGFVFAPGGCRPQLACTLPHAKRVPRVIGARRPPAGAAGRLPRPGQRAGGQGGRSGGGGLHAGQAGGAGGLVHRCWRLDWGGAQQRALCPSCSGSSARACAAGGGPAATRLPWRPVAALTATACFRAEPRLGSCGIEHIGDKISKRSCGSDTSLLNYSSCSRGYLRHIRAGSPGRRHHARQGAGLRGAHHGGEPAGAQAPGRRGAARAWPGLRWACRGARLLHCLVRFVWGLPAGPALGFVCSGLSARRVQVGGPPS